MKRFHWVRLLWGGIVAGLLVGAGIRAHAQAERVWLETWSGGTTTPSNVALYPSATTSLAAPWAFFLTRGNATISQTGTVIVSRPSTVAQEAYPYFRASFEFTLFGGGGLPGEGLSFSFGPVADGNNSRGSRGLATGLVLRIEAQNTGEGRLSVLFNDRRIEEALIPVEQGLWAQTPPSHFHRMSITNGNNGLTVKLERVGSDGLIQRSDTLFTNLQIRDWNPASDWRFVFGGSVLADRRMTMLVNKPRITVTPVPYFSGLPSTVDAIEDSADSFDVTAVSDPAFGAVTVTAASLDQALIPSSSISVTPQGNGVYRIAFQSALNAAGTGNLQLTVTQSGRSSSAIVPVVVVPVNDPPTVSMTAQAFLEDNSRTVGITLQDVDTPPANITLSIVSTTDASLIPLSNLQITGSGQFRNLIATPLPNRTGVAFVVIRANDGAGGQTDASVRLEVLPVNDPPIAGSPNALGFDGTNGGLVARSVGLTTGNTSHTVEAWVYPAALPSGRAALLRLGETGTPEQWALASDGTLQLGNLSGSPQLSGTSLPVGRWSHLATVWDASSSTYSLYLNGTKVSQITGGSFDLTPAALFLSTPLGTDQRFMGLVDDVRLWNRALTDGEIATRMNVALRGSESGLLVYLPFDEGSLEAMADRAASGGASVLQRSSGLFLGPRLAPNSGGMVAEYYATPDLTQLRAVRRENTIDFASTTGSFHPDVPADGFSARFRGSFFAFGGGTYQFRTESDDGVRLMINGQTVINGWTNIGPQALVSSVSLAASQWHDVVLEYRDVSGLASVRLLRALPFLNTFDLFPNGDLRPYAKGEDPAGGFGVVPVNEDTTTPIYLAGFDVENFLGQSGGTPFNFTLVTAPAHGTLRAGVVDLVSGGGASLTDPNTNPVQYTPAAGYSGTDFFVYRLTDGNGATSADLRVNIRVEEQNDPPTISLISNRTIEEGTSTGPIPFTVGDAINETPAADLEVTAAPQRQSRLLTPQSIVLGGSGANRTITVTPVPGQIGTVTIDVMVRDKGAIPLSTTRSFKLRVDPVPAYALVDLGDLGTLNQSFGYAINDLGWTVGGAQSQDGDGHAWVNRGLSGFSGAADLDSRYQATAFAIGPDNSIVGFFRPTANGARTAFLWRDGVLGSLSARLVGSDQVGQGLNSSGDVVGSYLRSPENKRRPFRLPAVGSVTELPLPTGFADAGEALAINAPGQVVGFGTDSTGRSRGFLWSGSTSVSIGALAGHDFSRAHAVNDDGLVVGVSAVSQDPNAVGRAILYQNAALTDLGLLPGGSVSAAWGINNFGQIVGTADRETTARAFLHTAGTLRDLNDLIHDSASLEFATSGWSLRVARGINTEGAIVGTGRKGANDRAFLAVPAWVIGRPIAPPELAVDRMPEIEVISGADGATAANSFFWSDHQKRLYPIRPVTARLKWYTSLDNTSGTGNDIQVNTDRIVRDGVSVWPRNPVYHVANVPVEIEPKGVTPFNHAFQGILYQTTGGAAQVDPTTKIFNSSQSGYSVIYYLETQGFSPNPSSQPPYFEVVRTVPWNDPAHLRERTALVGQKLADPAGNGSPGHQDYFGKNGYVYFANAYYDGAGTDRAHDRATRLGPIIPVNLDRADTSDDDLVVVWYRFSRIGVAWGGVPVRYAVAWPANDAVDTIVIASGRGSGPLPSAYRNVRPYVQDDPAQPGYNLNEEHALMAPANGGTGQALFALRDDLNDELTPQVSEPYALLKYQDGDAGDEWSIRVYRVVAEQSPYFFVFEGTAGREIQPPYPLSLLPLCAESYGSSGPWWEDWKGTLYARAAGEFGESTEIHVRWGYPLQPGFYYPPRQVAMGSGPAKGENAVQTGGRRTAQKFVIPPGTVIQINTPTSPSPVTYRLEPVPVGSCVAWLDRRKAGALASPNAGAGTQDVPIDVVYRVSWPETPLLQIGETLTTPKNGLPAVKDMASVALIYDDLTPDWNPLDDKPISPVETLARLYDPLSARTYRLKANEAIPDAIKRSNRGGKEYFDDVPPALQQRLTYDPGNRWLQFSGVLDTSGAGEPLLLPNVLTSRERDAIQRLAEGNTAWAAIVDALYDITRNPNQVDVDGDKVPDRALRIGLAQDGDVVYPENLGALPKALTAAVGGVPPATFHPVKALQLRLSGEYNELDAAGQYADAGYVDLQGRSFTLEFWARRDASSSADTVAGLGTAGPNGQLIVGWDAANRFVFRFHATDDNYGVTTVAAYPDVGEWHHWAVVFDAPTLKQRIYRDGVLVAEDTSLTTCQAVGNLQIGRREGGPLGEEFAGQLEEFRLWDVALSGALLARDRAKGLTGHEDGLVRYYRFNAMSGRPATLVDDSPERTPATVVGAATLVDSDAPAAIPPRYLVLAENDSPALAGLPVKLHIIRVDDGPYSGDLKVIYPGNVFDQRLTMRHSSEFGGDPNPVTFEWYYKPDDAAFDPTDLPVVSPTGAISDIRGWIPYSNIRPADGRGVNDVTIGQGGESGLLTLGDTWFICRIKGYNVRGQVPWSGWIGDPSGGGTPRAQLAEGWVKRVIRGLNPFDARTADFHGNASATYTSMIRQAGPRYEGDIAFNPSGDNLNSLGLIEAYTTVLNRGKSLSIEGLPPVNFNPANNALLLAAARIADFYTLLGNEAYADAQDPTIGFTGNSEPYGALASSIFAFQNQLDSLLEEELVLLRGRDDRQAGVGAPPVYNHLFWNFTLGDGEVAYQQNYNVNDVNTDGFIDEKDARILYPQGHGDAWGHYLTAMTTYYDLLRHPMFTWVPRTERVLVAGVPVEVDFLDERKFAQAAAAKARTGREIVDLTYRSAYVDDPDGQWQGYKDTDASRAWGVAEWAWRAGQGAYFDWLTVNAILPSTDPNPARAGIQKIDRQTVTDADEILAQYTSIQGIIDSADAGLNPLGLVKGAMQFDLDPTFLAVGSTAAIGRQAVQGLSHFEQLNERALKALKNAQRVWDEANAQSRNLRQNQDTVDAFARNARNEESNFRNQLIEIFGYPYAGDIGAGKTYPSGYDGPDLYHYMYVPVTEITGETVPPSDEFTGFFTQVNVGLLGSSHFPTEESAYFTEYTIAETDPVFLDVTYPQAQGPWAFAAPRQWGSRRAPGRVQEAISDVLQASARLKFAGQNYDALILDIQDRVDLLEARFAVNDTEIQLLNDQRDTLMAMNAAIGTMKGVSTVVNRLSILERNLAEAIAEGMPKVVGVATDVTAPARGALGATFAVVDFAAQITVDSLDVAQSAVELSKEDVPLTTEIDLRVNSQSYEVLQQVKELESLVRNEINLRLEVFEQQEVLRQSYGRLLSTIAEGQRVLDRLVRFRKDVAADTTEYRYRDMAFRIFRNDALQKYRATFDLAARYVYICATAYDFESNFLGSDRRVAGRFFDEIVRQRQLGVLVDGEPIPGRAGLADIQGRMIQNWEILEPQFGLNNPQLETGRFSLRSELFRLRDADPGRANDPSDEVWRAALKNAVVANLWDVPEFRRYCRPFTVENPGQPQPGLVIRFPTTVQFGQNFFGKPLGGGDTAFDPTYFSTKINAVGVTFPGYDDVGLARAPRVYLVPVGQDVMRSPTGNTQATRQWRVLDQAVPVPFAVGANDFTNPSWIPGQDSLSENFGQPRRFASLRAYTGNEEIDEAEITASTRLVARSVWNTEWLLIIPGGTLLNNPTQGLDRFINSVEDIRLLMMVYSFAGQ